MKIAIALDSPVFTPNVSGVTVFGEGLALFLKSIGWNVDVITTGSKREVVHEIHPSGVVVWRLPGWPNPFRKKDSFLIAVQPERYMEKILKEIDPDILHIQGCFGLCSAAIRAAEQLKIPTVATQHFTVEFMMAYMTWCLHLLGPWGKKLLKRLLEGGLWRTIGKEYNHVGVVTCPSRIIAGKIKEYTTTPVEVIPNGVDLKRFCPNGSTPADIENLKKRWGLKGRYPIILYLGRVDPDNGVDIPIKAMKKVLDWLPKAFLLVVGEGKEEDWLKRWSSGLGLESHVRFTGKIDHDSNESSDKLVEIYRLADCLILPSTKDVLSIVWLEQGATSGAPTLIPKGSAMVEVIEHRKNGCRFKTGSAADLAGELKWLFQTRKSKFKEKERVGRLQKMREYNLGYVHSNHDINHVHDQFKDIYTALHDKLIAETNGRTIPAPLKG